MASDWDMSVLFAGLVSCKWMTRMSLREPESRRHLSPWCHSNRLTLPAH